MGALQDLVRQHEEAQKAAWADRGKMVVRVDAAVAEAAVSLSGRNGAELAQSRASGFFCRACVFPGEWETRMCVGVFLQGVRVPQLREGGLAERLLSPSSAISIQTAFASDTYDHDD